jgi:hypothetical protein
MLNTAVQYEQSEISTSITKNWTEQAVECYKLNGNCSECSIRQAHYTFDCQMPRVVEVLKLINGEPDLNEF